MDLLQRWIDVKDSLPDIEQKVLIAYKKATAKEYYTCFGYLEPAEWHESAIEKWHSIIVRDDRVWITDADKDTYIESSNDIIYVYYWMPFPETIIINKNITYIPYG
jgi:hypothetical protein